MPLAEAWDSGARSWSTSRRQAYANDLGGSRPLAAVTDNVNQARSDQDPATWLPSYSAARCRLTVDSAEKSALTSLAGGCPNATISVTYAYRGEPPPPRPSPVPAGAGVATGGRPSSRSALAPATSRACAPSRPAAASAVSTRSRVV